jgi:phage terminase large subunit-like protein
MNYPNLNELQELLPYLNERDRNELDSLLLAETPSTDPDAVPWIQDNFFIPETNKAIVLAPYQRAVVEEALAKDGDLFRYSFILWSDLKKSAKSTIAGAMALYLAWHHGWESVRIVGNDLKQADSRTFFYIERAIRMNPNLNAQCSIKNYEITLPNHTVISAIPVDPKGEAGGGDLATVFTEMWAMKNKASQQMWSETTLSPLKYGKSLRIGESYAGIRGESPVLEPLYEQGVKQGVLVPTEIPGLELYRNQRMLCLWNTQPRCDWQTKEYYAQEAGSLTPSEFNRLHKNQWAESSESFIPVQWWDECTRVLESMRDKEPCVMALDAAVESDCFALALITVKNANGQRIPQVRYVRIWKPPHNGQINFAEVEQEIQHLIQKFSIIEISYDPYMLADMAQRLGQLAFWKPFLQAGARLVADKMLYDLIRDRRIEHNGDSLLREHMANADRKPEEDKLRIIKRSPQLKIDGVVCVSMGVNRALYYQL